MALIEGGAKVCVSACKRKQYVERDGFQTPYKLFFKDTIKTAILDVCKDCHISCATCSGGLETECTSCELDLEGFPLFLTPDGRCERVCPERYWPGRGSEGSDASLVILGVCGVSTEALQSVFCLSLENSEEKISLVVIFVDLVTSLLLLKLPVSLATHLVKNVSGRMKTIASAAAMTSTYRWITAAIQSAKKAHSKLI